MSDPLFEEKLHKLCKDKDTEGFLAFLKETSEDTIIKLALMPKQHILIEDVAKYLIVNLSNGKLLNEQYVHNFLSLISRYKLTCTRVESQINLYLNSKRIISQVHDVQLKENENMSEKSTEEMKNETQKLSIKCVKSDIGQAVCDNEGKIIWVDHYTSWLWERTNKELIGSNFFDLFYKMPKKASPSSRAFPNPRSKETFFGPRELCKVMPYELKRGFECIRIDPNLSNQPKVLTSQFTRIMLAINGSDNTQFAVHIKTRPSSRKTFDKFLSLYQNNS